MAEYDSDLEGKDEQVTVHDDTVTANTSQLSKKRRFHEMEDDDNHYTSKHSKNKVPKLDQQSNDIEAFLNDSEDDEDDEDDIDDDAQNEDIVFDKDSTLIQDVEFELNDIHELYYHEVKDILAATEWDQKKLNVVQLTDIIIKQEEIGGVLMSENSVLGVITLLSFKKYFEHLSLAHIKRFIANRCKLPIKKKKFENYFSDKHNIGLLLHERPINVPLELVPYIYESLWKDMQYATNKEEAKHLSDEEIELFKCDYIMMVVRYRWVPTDDGDNNNNKEKKKEKKEEDEDIDLKEEILLPHLLNNRNKMKLVYEHLEEDLFVKKAEFQFDFERNDKIWNVLFVKTAHLKDIVQEMHQLFTPH